MMWSNLLIRSLPLAPSMEGEGKKKKRQSISLERQGLARV